MDEFKSKNIWIIEFQKVFWVEIDNRKNSFDLTNYWC